MPSIRETVIVSTDGFVVASCPPPDIHDVYHPTSTPQVAAMAASLLALGDQTLARLAQGEMHRLMIEGEEGAIIVYPINRNAALAALVSKTAKMGLALHEIARTARELLLVSNGEAVARILPVPRRRQAASLAAHRAKMAMVGMPSETLLREERDRR
jgi:predicted regulator of Ras-like GTPase activity (Roadblock/LC7/MglB family)